MIGRHRPVGPRQRHHVAIGLLRGGLARRLDEQCAGPVAVKPEILVAALRDDRLLDPTHHQPRTGGVGLEAVAEALIGKIDERDQAALDDEARQFVPLVEAEVGSGRIVAAAVEQHQVARARVLERGHHPVEVRACGCSCRNNGSRPSRGQLRRAGDRGSARWAGRRRCGVPGMLHQVRAEPQCAASAEVCIPTIRRSAASASPNVICRVSSAKRVSPSGPR